MGVEEYSLDQRFNNEGGGLVFWLVLLVVLLVVVLAGAYLVGPDLARYMRIRRM